MIPLRTTAPARRRPILVLLLVAACSLIFLWQIGLPEREAWRIVALYALIPRRYSDPHWALANGLDPGDYLPFLSMAFLHGGWLHLIFNMWTLWLFGRAVEARMGRLRFALLYVFCALLAAWAQMLVYPDSMVPTLGASGAIAGVLGAHATLYPRARVVVLLPIIIIPLFFRISALWFVGVWFGIQVLQGTTALMAPGLGGGVAWWAHIGGFLAGLLFVRFLTPPGGPGMTESEETGAAPARRPRSLRPWGRRPPSPTVPGPPPAPWGRRPQQRPTTLPAPSQGQRRQPPDRR